MHKKAIELSINFIVIMIFSIAILSSSFLLVNQFFGKAEAMKARLDSDTESKIRSMLVSGERVAIPVQSQEIGLGKPVTFAIGISNILRDDNGPINTFTIGIEPCSAVGDHTPPLPALEVIYSPTIDIKKNDNQIALFVVNTKGGERLVTYKCDVTVKYTYTDPITHTDQFKDYQAGEPVYKAYVKIK